MYQDIKGNKSDREIVASVSGLQRLMSLSNFCFIISYIGISVCPICAFINWVKNSTLGMTFLVLTLVSVLMCVFLGKSTNKLKARIKELVGQYIVRDILAEKIDIVKYSPNQYINKQFVKDCMILPNFDKINGSDYISGIYRGKKFTYCDLLLEIETREEDDDGHRSKTTKTMFNGHLVTMDLGKDIGGYVRIREKKNSRKKKGFLANVLGLGSSGNSIETENIAFNNQFEIKTSDDQLAFYILTPQFMESVMRLDELAAGYTNIEFRGTSVVIALNNGRDSFEINKSLHSTKRLERYRQSFRNEFDVILGVLDEILTKDNLF